MTAKSRVVLLFFIDLAIIWFSIVTSYMFRFYDNFPQEYVIQMLQFGLISTVSFGGESDLFRFVPENVAICQYWRDYFHS